MTPTLYVGGGSHGTQNPTPETERNERSTITGKNPLCRQGDGGRGAKSGLISSGITPPRRDCPRWKARQAAAKRRRE